MRVIVFKTREQFQPYSPNAIDAAYFTEGPQRDYIVLSDPSLDSYSIAVHEYFH